MPKDFETQIQEYIDAIKNPDQKKSIIKFVRYCKDSGKSTHKGKPQSLKTVYYKVMCATAIGAIYDKPFNEFTRGDLEDYVDSDEFRLYKKVGKDGKRKEVAQSSLQAYKMHLRTFFKWVHYGRDRQKMRKAIYPDVVDWIEIQLIKKETRPEDLFTEEETFNMINGCDRLRDQLFIALLYDTGGRLGEILDLTEDRVKSDSYGFLIHVDGKTGMRNIRLYMSVPYVKQYLQTPVRGRHLIHTVHGRMSDSHAENIIKKAAKDAGITRGVYPHLFRHTTATRLASKLTEPELKAFAGWTPSSQMTGHYVHMNGERIDSRMREIYGMKEAEEDTPSILAPQTCSRCQEINVATKQYCKKCGFNLKDDIPFESEADLMKKESEKQNVKMELMQRNIDMMQKKFEESLRIRQYERDNAPVLTPEQQRKQADDVARLQVLLSGEIPPHTPSREEIEFDIGTLRMCPQSSERDKMLRALQSTLSSQEASTTA